MARKFKITVSLPCLGCRYERVIRSFDEGDLLEDLEGEEATDAQLLDMAAEYVQDGDELGSIMSWDIELVEG